MFDVYFYNKLDAKTPVAAPNPMTSATKATTHGLATTTGNNEDLMKFADMVDDEEENVWLL